VAPVKLITREHRERRCWRRHDVIGTVTNWFWYLSGKTSARTVSWLVAFSIGADLPLELVLLLLEEIRSRRREAVMVVEFVTWPSVVEGSVG